MKQFIFLLGIALLLGKVVGAQEKVFTLQQLIDSALANRMVFSPEDSRLQNTMANGTDGLFMPIEISYRRGHLYSLEVEQEWRIRQELQSPVRWLDMGRIKTDMIASFRADSLLKEKQRIAAVKKTYFLCVYRYALYNHYRRVMDMVDRMLVGIPQDSLDETVVWHYSEWLLRLQDSYFDWLEAQNELRGAVGLQIFPIPADTVPELYQIEPVPDTLTRTPARLFYNALQAQLKYKDSQEQRDRHGYWPSFFIDVSIRNGINRQNLMAWQVGVRIPLASWFNDRQLNVSDSRRFRAEYEWQKQKEFIDYQSERLIILMNKRFAQVNYYRNRILPRMERDTYGLVNQMFDDQSVLSESVSKFLSWQSYYTDYLNAIYEYNCLAAELEVLAY
ncbi:MAG: hypothetical protein ACP5PS_10805 [Bacteroidales bacterium]